MTLCASCGFELQNDQALCNHHHVVYATDAWAIANRIMCDLLHRGVEPRRLPKHERDSEF